MGLGTVMHRVSRRRRAGAMVFLLLWRASMNRAEGMRCMRQAVGRGAARAQEAAPA